MYLSFDALLGQLRRDVALRNGLISALATLFALLLLTAIFWVFLTDRLETRLENSLAERHEISVKNAVVRSPEERKLLQDFRRSLPLRDEGVFAWMDHEGEVFSGSVKGVECQDDFYDGWLDISQLAIVETPQMLANAPADSSSYDRFRFLARKRPQGCLVFGSSLFEVDAMREGALMLMLWVVPLCLLPSLLISFYQSTKLRGRLHRLGNVVQSLSKGNLDARMPVEGDDDIDRLAGSANQSFDRLQESVSTMQQLTSVMAHDLRAPLNRVAIPLDEAMRANQSGQPAVESLEKIKGGLADVRSVFDALLRISQIESGRRRSKFSDVDLFVIAEGMFEIYEAVVEDADRTLELDISGEGTSIIQGDKDLIRQATVNLIENAVRYSPSGSLIKICVVRDPEHPQLIIKDNGPGLPDEERPRVLRRLYRYEGSTSGQEGHGLGLSLVKAVIDLHEGTIALEDTGPGLLVSLQFNAQHNLPEPK